MTHKETNDKSARDDNAAGGILEQDRSASGRSQDADRKRHVRHPKSHK